MQPLDPATDEIIAALPKAELVTTQLAEDAAAQGTRYLEVIFTPSTHHRQRGIPFGEMMGAIAGGADAARRLLPDGGVVRAGTRPWQPCSRRVVDCLTAI